MRFLFKRKRFYNEKEKMIKESFGKSREELKILFFRLISMTISLLAMVFILNVIITQKVNIFLLLAAILAVLLSLLIFAFVRKPIILKNLSFLICLYIFIFQMFALESGRLSVYEDPQPRYMKEIYFKGLLGNLLNGINFLSPSPCWMISIQNFGSVLILMIRVLNEGTAGISYPEIILTLAFLFLLNTFLKYKSEKNEMNTFKNIVENSKKLEIYKILMEDLLLNAIIIIREDSLESYPDIIHANKCALNWFQTPDSSQLSNLLMESTAHEIQGVSANLITTSIKSQQLSLVKLIKAKSETLGEGEFTTLSMNAVFRRCASKNNETLGLLEIDQSGENEVQAELKVGRFVWESVNSVLILFNDISNAKKILDLQALHQCKDELLATVSHELRTPLNGIIGMVDLVNQQIENKSINKRLNVAVNAGKNLLHMVNDILDNSQISRGLLRLQFEHTVVSEIIEKVVQLMKYQSKKKGVKLIKQYKCSKDTQICVDPIRLQQVLVNLIGNSLKFTDKGSITISVKYHKGQNTKSDKGQNTKCDKGNIWKCDKGRNTEYDGSKTEAGSLNRSNACLIFSVEDTGCGIREENLKKLFKLFSTFEDGHSNPNGIGLGLAVSQKLAESFLPKKGGGIQVRSKIGHGSKFWFPVMITDPEKITALQIDEGTQITKPYELHRSLRFGERSSVCYRVLLVDDDHVNHFVIENYLLSFDGFYFEGVNNGFEALNSIKRSRESNIFYDLIILDTNMPLMNGFETGLEIIKLVENKEIPPMKLASFSAEQNCRLSTLPYNIFKIDKPITIEDFKNLIEAKFEIKIKMRRKSSKNFDLS